MKIEVITRAGLVSDGFGGGGGKRPRERQGKERWGSAEEGSAEM